MTSTAATDLPMLLRLVERATLAPSVRNTQPWSWAVRPDGTGLDLLADPDRGLGVADPLGRELVMSCGAALLTLRVAAAHARLGLDVDVLPDPRRPDLLARVRRAEHATDVEFAALDAVVPVRRTWRGPMRAEAVPAPLRERLAAEAHAEGAVLVEVPAGTRETVARLVAGADVAHGADRGWRAEQARWVRSRSRRDGVRLSAAAVLPTRLAIRYLDLGGYVGAQDAALVRAAPLLAVLATSDDGPAGWLAAGQALQRVLLVAQAHGLAVGFANSVCEDDDRRAALGSLLGGPAPQAVLRVGRRPGSMPRPTRSSNRSGDQVLRRAVHRRRPVGEVVRLSAADEPADEVADAPAQRNSTSPVSTS